jgi:hypothetical protein
MKYQEPKYKNKAFSQAGKTYHYLLYLHLVCWKNIHKAGWYAEKGQSDCVLFHFVPVCQFLCN